MHGWQKHHDMTCEFLIPNDPCPQVIDLADKAVENRSNCKQIADLVLSCDKALGQVPEAQRQQRLGAAEAEVKRLTNAMQQARDVVEKFGHGRGMLMRLITATQDALEFESAHKGLVDAMAVSGWRRGRAVLGAEAAQDNLASCQCSDCVYTAPLPSCSHAGLGPCGEPASCAVYT